MEEFFQQGIIFIHTIHIIHICLIHTNVIHTYEILAYLATYMHMETRGNSILCPFFRGNLTSICTYLFCPSVDIPYLCSYRNHMHSDVIHIYDSTNSYGWLRPTLQSFKKTGFKAGSVTFDRGDQVVLVTNVLFKLSDVSCAPRMKALITAKRNKRN